GLIENPLARRRSDARQQMKHAEACDPVAGVLDELEQGKHVLDMGGVQKLQAAELDEGNIAPRQLDLQRAAVGGRPEQDSLLLETRSLLAVRQHLLDDVARLVRLVADGD